VKRSCYFQGCDGNGDSKEHIPPKSFFPTDQRDQLLTVRSCPKHNEDKSPDDLYVLAQICMNASPANGAREVFMERIGPQLEFNDEALRKMLIKNSVELEGGARKYKVDSKRLDRFFSALSFGIVHKACGAALPENYKVGHVYHNLISDELTQDEKLFQDALADFYSGPPLVGFNVGTVKALNTNIYSVKLFGLPDFQSSITVTHEFFGTFKVTSMLSLMHVASGG
jgi:hypothetical protein